MGLVRICFLLVLTAILLAACNSPSAPSTSDNVASFLPLHVGNIWTYDEKAPSYMAVIDKRIIDTMRHPDGSLLYAYNEDVRVNNPSPSPPITAYHTCHDDAVYMYYFAKDSSIGSFIFPKVPLLKGPLVVGNNWICNWGSYVDSFSIVSVGYSSFKGNTVYTVSVVQISPSVIDTSWYGEGIGLLKRRMHSLQDGGIWSWDLESYNIVQ